MNLKPEKEIKEVFRTVFRFASDHPEELHITDTINHDGELWMVLTWIDYTDGHSEPEQMICLSSLPHKAVSFSEFGYHYECLRPLEEELFYGNPRRANPPPSCDSVSTGLWVPSRKTGGKV